MWVWKNNSTVGTGSSKGWRHPQRAQPTRYCNRHIEDPTQPPRRDFYSQAGTVQGLSTQGQLELNSIEFFQEFSLFFFWDLDLF